MRAEQREDIAILWLITGDRIVWQSEGGVTQVEQYLQLIRECIVFTSSSQDVESRRDKT